MSGSSENTISIFTGLRLNHIRTMLELVTDQRLHEKRYIERRFLEHATEFDTTLAFLTKMKLVHDDGNNLSLTPKLRVNDDDLSKTMLLQLTETSSPWRTELFAYLRNFRIRNDNMVHRPTPEQRSSESAIRNFLMELGAVSFDAAENRYVLAANCCGLLTQACSTISVSPSRIRDSQQANNDIGRAAECAAVEYEQHRLGAELAERVDHVATRNAAAGFDIQSVTVLPDGEIRPRLIEVKAVSQRNFSFFWTENEITVARTFGAWYYLYLLPVGSDGRFRRDLLRIVCDPHSAVLECSDQWTVERNVLRCQLLEDSSE
jgi:Domain of unknown function (DUF3883)